MATPGRTWNDDEVQALLAICADASIQKQLLGSRRKVKRIATNRPSWYAIFVITEVTSLQSALLTGACEQNS